MAKKLRARLRSRAGESISEVLIALLISSLGLVLLAGMISASVRMLQRNEENMTSYITGGNTLAAQPSQDKNGNVTLQYGSASNTVDVTYYETSVNGKTVISYKYKAG